MREKGFTPVMSVTRLSSLCQRLTSTNFGITVAMCLYARFVARSSTQKYSIDRQKKLVCGKPHHRKSFCKVSIEEIIFLLLLRPYVNLVEANLS